MVILFPHPQKSKSGVSVCVCTHMYVETYYYEGTVFLAHIIHSDSQWNNLKLDLEG